MDFAPIVQLLTPFIIELVGEYRHKNDVLTPEIVEQRLKEKIDSGELKIDATIAEILRNQKMDKPS